MTYKLQENQDWQHHVWTREECRKIDARMRALRRELFWQRRKLAIGALAVLGIVVVAFGILMKVN